MAKRCCWDWAAVEDRLDRMLWSVSRTVADVPTLTEQRNKRCECDREIFEWLFLDTIQNHSRRWCTMKDCGNRDKVRRYRQRRRAKQDAH